MHRREYLIRDGKIDPLAYTGDIKDYLKKDIIQSLSKPHKGKKEDLFRSFDEEIKILNKYKDDIENIIKVQNMIKKGRQQQIAYKNNDQTRLDQAL